MKPNPRFSALQVMQDAPVIPVIVLNDISHAVPLARALVAGGIRMLEVTLRTPQALACIEAIARDVPEAVVGAGTVRTRADAQAASMAGALFAVSPGYTSALGQACRDVGLALLPGVATGGEIMLAQEDGFTELKFFPARGSAGIPWLRNMAPVFPDVVFCPTGGIQPADIPDYLALPNCCTVGGSWIAPSALVQDQNWPEITKLALQSTKMKIC